MAITRTTRLLNFGIDMTVYLLIVLALIILFKPFLSRDTIRWSMIAVYYLYYLIFELTTGQTVGKMCTETKVSTTSGGKPHVKHIFLRTFFRILPADALSFLWSPVGFHDRLSKTILYKPKL